MANEEEKKLDTSGSKNFKDNYQIKGEQKDVGSIGKENEEKIHRIETVDFHIGQLESKVDSIYEKVKRDLETRKWILITTITFASICIVFFTLFINLQEFIYNIFQDSQSSYQELQNTYYKELIDLRKEINIQSFEPKILIK